MSKTDFKTARNSTHQFISDSNIENHMYYGPGDAYWAENPKILMINMEAYGYDSLEVTKEDLWDWVTDAGDTKTRTAKTTAAFAATFFRAIESSLPATPGLLQQIRTDLQILDQTLDRICYYNIKSTANDQKDQDFSGIVECGFNALSPFIKNEILALEADFVFVSGEAGTTALAEMFNLQLPNRGSAQIGKTKVYSLRHMSRSNYTEYCIAINDAASSLAP